MGDSPPAERRPVLEDITVLIPTLGRELLAGCLEAVSRGSVFPAALLVVDQGQNPRVGTWLQSVRSTGLEATHLPSSRQGTAAAMNQGLRRVTTPLVAVTHDDCVPATDWLERLHAALRREAGVLVTGRVEPGGEGVVVSINTSPTPARYLRPALSGEVLFPNNMGFGLEIFERVGPFDERDFVRVAEDNDWSYRALRVGVPIVYAPDVVVSHLDWRSASELEDTYRAYARCQGGFYGKHLRRGDLFIALRIAVDLARALRRWLKAAIRRDADQKANGRAYLTQLVPGIFEGLRGAR